MVGMRSSPGNSNPLLAESSARFGLPPFAAIGPEHFRPAFDAALAAHRDEIDEIATEEAAPSFDNTIAALERSGRLLERVENVFFALAGADTNDSIEADRKSTRLNSSHGYIS